MQSILSKKKVRFKYDGSENGLSQLCGDILDYLEKFYRDFFESIDRDYGTLEEYYIANKEENPLLAGVVYIERGQFQNAEKCFRLPNMRCKNSCTSIRPVTKEQLARVSVSCEQLYCRSDYTIAYAAWGKMDRRNSSVWIVARRKTWEIVKRRVPVQHKRKEDENKHESSYAISK